MRPRARRPFSGRFSAALLLGCSAFAIAFAPPSAAQESQDPPPPPLGVWRASVGGLEVRETVLPHPFLGAAAWPGGGLAVLVGGEDPGEEPQVEISVGAGDSPPPPEAPDLASSGSPASGEGAPRQLFRVRGERGDLSPVLESLPERVDAILEVGGRLWLGSEEALYRVVEGAGGARLETVIERPGLGLAALGRGDLLSADSLWLPRVGALEHYRLAVSAGGALTAERLESHELPVLARRFRRSLTLRSRPVFRLPSGTLVAGPEKVGPARVRHIFFPAQEPSAEGSESWSRFPGPEDVDRAWYLEIDGQPAFLAATTRADRLGVFEKLKLRIFRLRADRTRAGREPMFALETRTRNWYGVEPRILDWDRDGKDDLALIQPAGLRNKSLVVDVYRGRANRFNPKPLRSSVDAESARWHFGDDLDGDSVPDLIVGTNTLEIYRGDPNSRRRVLEKKPWRTLSASAF
ncbi:MAG: VCBS repeat-containing protein, partial [Acidobacteriota bacterium]